MTEAPAGMERLSPNQRVQHALLALLVCAAFASGLLLGRPSGAGPSTAGAWHVAAGLGAVALLAYHFLYLAVLGYLETGGWGGFPLRWERGDARTALAEAAYVFGRAPARPEAGAYRVSQKALYWWVVAALLLLGATGAGVRFWERFGTLGSLSHLAALHRGCALTLLASVLWHLYGVLTWEGRWWPEWSWLGGTLDAAKAQRKHPLDWRRRLDELAAREHEAAAAASRGEEARARQAGEKASVLEDLEKGNLLAREERYVEALYHYRRALELYPGYAQARYNMATVLYRMGEREMALEAYRQFLAADPFHPLAHKAQEAIREIAGEEGRR